MIGKKINQLATELAPATTDLTIIGDPVTGVSKKITLAQLGAIFSGAVSFYTNLAAFPVTGDINVIYCAKDTQKLYLWSGSAYVEVFPSQALLDTYQLRSEKGNANGYASLDSGGKVPISQLPSSIMEYKGTWNAATNTPTLANGTGDTGDVYICNVAGTVNFGAGPLTFAVGDYVIYSGTIWQRSSGAVGTVTSVAITESGDSLNITGSPITTSGTINIGFNGTNLQYVNGAGNLTTFPILTGFVPYTGATANVDLGIFDLTADVITGATGSFASSGGSDTFSINHSSGAGIALNITKGGNGEGLYINKTSGSGNAATIVGTLNATTLVKSGGTSAQFLKADGSVDSTSYQPLLTNPVTGTGVSGQVTFFNGTSTVTGSNNHFWDATNNRLGIGTTTPQRSIEIFNSTADNHLRLSGNAPSVSMGEAVTGSIYQAKFGLVTVNGQFVTAGVAGDFVIISQTGATIIGTSSTEKMRVQSSGNVSINNTNDTYKLDVTGTARLTGQLRLESTITDGTYTYTLPSATGTLALTSALSGYLPLTGGTLTGTLNTTTVANGVNLIGPTSNPSYYTVDQSVNNAGKRWRFGHTGAIGGFTSFDFYNQTDNITALTLASTGAATFSGSIAATSATFSSSVTATSFNGTTNNIFSVSGTEGMRLTSTGLGIGTTAPAYPLQVRRAGGGGSLGISIDGVGSTDRTVQYFAIQDSASGAGAGHAFYYRPPSSTTDTLGFILDENGSVGIGTTSPSTILHVKGSSNYNGILKIDNSTTTGGGAIMIAQNGASSGLLTVLGSALGTSARDLTYYAEVGLGHAFFVNDGTRVLDITSNGRVGIGTTSPSQKLHIYGTGSGAFSSILNIENSTSSASLIQFSNTVNGFAFGFNSTTTQRFVFINGGPTEIANINGATGVYTALSDKNKKKDFELSTLGLDAIMGLKPTLYRMKSENGTEKHLGFIAQEVKDFIPQAFVQNADFIGLTEMPIVAALTKAVQELKQELDTLKNK